MGENYGFCASGSGKIFIRGELRIKYSFGTACIWNSEVQRRNKSNYGDSALRLRSGQNDEQKQTKANTEILAEPE
jgi:hypothetical protein